MLLQDLIHDLPLEVVRGRRDLSIKALCDDSRRVATDGPGCMFIARSGANQDGRSFIPQAIRDGAVAVVTDQAPPADEPDTARGEVAWVTAKRVDQHLVGRLAEVFFGFPSRKLRLIGVTGTNGKTTTSLILAHLLKSAGLACGVVGTLFIDDGHSQNPTQLTTPGALDLSRILADMARNGCAAAVLETSSHALQQGRTAALDFDAGIFTNLTGDHLDYHHSMAQYAQAKARLFGQLRPDAWAVVNADDSYSEHMIHDCSANVLRCKIREHEQSSKADNSRPEPTCDSECQATLINLTDKHSRAHLTGPWGTAVVTLPMLGRHNVANALYAAAAAHVLTGRSDLLAALENCPPVSGRLQPVRVPGSAGPLVIVDYAHTHDALKNVLGTLRPITRGKLIVVFGCGGDRDTTKRPRMARAACKTADRVVVTSDNPRSEDPAAIIDDILEGVPSGSAVLAEPDRAKAINLAVSQAQADDIVLLAGKGHEPYQDMGQIRHHFDDREQAAEALRRRNDC